MLDYDELLLYWTHMMDAPTLAQTARDRFGHVVVDEYQDTRALQARIVINTRPDGRGLAVVGDDAQSIYSFRAASVQTISDFPKQFVPTAHVVALEQNYRSTDPILCLVLSRFTATLPLLLALAQLRCDVPSGDWTSGRQGLIALTMSRPAAFG